MKITTQKKPLHEAPHSFVRVIFEDTDAVVVREKEGVTELVIPRKKELSLRTFRTLVRLMTRTAKQYGFTHIAVDATHILNSALLAKHTREDILAIFAENAVIAHYEFTLYKTKRKEKKIEEICFFGLEAKDVEGLKKGFMIGTYVNHARDLSNTPGGDMTPEVLARGAQNLAKNSKVTVKVLGVQDIAKLKMGAILGVAKGSSATPRFIIMEYWGAGKKASSQTKGTKKVQSSNASDTNNPIIFIGKGITFDTGGLNLKPGESALEMHMDMSGGAAVIAAIVAASQLGLKRNIIALIPAAENMVSGESYRPGDILKTMSGKTVEVLNTDAEGRLVLADALTYAERYTPRLVIDVATLTGAALVALGQHASALMTKDTDLQNRLQELGEESGDYLWPLPLWDEYKQHTKGKFADIANIPSSGARYGGCINAGMFLSHFAEKYPWAHIDMAPRMTSIPSDNLAKGATGEMVRLLIAIAEKY
jgi:leucyl aminopeptidase